MIGYGSGGGRHVVDELVDHNHGAWNLARAVSMKTLGIAQLIASLNLLVWGKGGCALAALKYYELAKEQKERKGVPNFVASILHEKWLSK